MTPRDPRATLGALALLGALTFGVPMPGSAAEDKELDVIEQELAADRVRSAELARKADGLEREISILRANSIELAGQLQDQEGALTAIETSLAKLERLEEAKRAVLSAEEEDLGDMLAALQRISLRPVETWIAAPATPLETLRGGILLSVAVPGIEARARQLREQLDELSALRLEIATQRSQVVSGTEELERDRERLSGLIARKQLLHEETSVERQQAQERAEELAKRAKDLRDLMARIERKARAEAARKEKEEKARKARAEAARKEAAERAAARAEAEAAKQQTAEAPASAEVAEEAAVAEAEPAPEAADHQVIALARPGNIRPFPRSSASLTLPARGRIVLRFGQRRGNDNAAKGIRIASRDGAQVVAPFDGKVVYAGHFRSYGLILIIEHDERYHTLLAGFERIDAIVGQWLLAGEPVGVLGAAKDAPPELYLELRRAGQPINPLPWLATTGDKARG